MINWCLESVIYVKYFIIAYQSQGLKLDDLVLSVGSVDATNFTGLSQIGSLIQRSTGSVVSVKVKRENQVLKLALIPGPWTGRGLLGCNIVPYEESVER